MTAREARKWRDVPVGGVEYYSCTTCKLRRVSDEIVTASDGREMVQVEYAHLSGPENNPIEPGTLGLVEADENVGSEDGNWI